MPDFQIRSTPYSGAVPEAPPEQATLLFLLANPKDAVALNLNREFNGVQEELESARKAFRLRLRLDVEAQSLMEIMLRERPTILHFSGHGSGTGGLVLQCAQGYSQQVTTEALADLLAEFSDTVQCVVLNACYSDEQARVFARHVPFVVGTDSALGDEKAIRFARAFYTCLFLGEGYESAFRKAVVQTRVEQLGQGAQPILYRRSSEQTEMPSLQQNTENQAIENEAQKNETKPARTASLSRYAEYQMASLDWNSLFKIDVRLKLPLDHQILRHDDHVFESGNATSNLFFWVIESKSTALNAVFEELLESEKAAVEGSPKTTLLKYGAQIRYLKGNGLLLACIKSSTDKFFGLRLRYQNEKQADMLIDAHVQAL